HHYDFGGDISPEGLRRPEYDEAIALAATLDAWGERLATASPVPLSAVALDGAAAGGALALPGGGHLVGPAEVDGLERTVRLRPTTLADRADDGAAGDGAADGGAVEVVAELAPGTCPFWALDVPLAPWGSEGTLAVATAELVGVEPHGQAGDAQPLTLTFEGAADARIELVLPAAGGGEERLWLEG